MVGSPQHEMAKWIAERLAPVVRKYSQHTVKDSFQFCQDIDEFASSHDKIMSNTFRCSFDVCSLFTNVPLEHTTAIFLDALYHREDITPPAVPERLLAKLLRKATSEVEFSFGSQMFHQVEGIAMGSPLGPVLANIFLGHSEASIPQQDWPLFYRRYVDDTNAVFNSEAEADEFKDRLNNLHPALTFTMEKEADNTLSFLHFNIKRVGPVYSDQYTEKQRSQDRTLDMIHSLRSAKRPPSSHWHPEPIESAPQTAFRPNLTIYRTYSRTTDTQDMSSHRP